MYINYSNNSNSNNNNDNNNISVHQIQFKICSDKLTEFLNKSTPLNISLAAKTHLAVEEFLLVAKNKEWFLKLHKGTLIPVACKRDGQNFRPE
jgi:hypothetical protein